MSEVNNTQDEYSVEFNENSDVKKGISIKKGNLKFMLICGLVFIAIYLIFEFSNEDEKDFQPIDGVSIPSSRLPDPSDATNVGGVDKIELEKMNAQLEKDNNNNNIDVVVPPVVNLVVEEKPEVPQINLYQKNHNTTDLTNSEKTIEVSELYMTRMNEQINKIYSNEDLFTLNEVVYKYEKYTPVSVSEKQSTSTQSNIRYQYPHQIPYLKLIPGMMILGHNSDLGKEMIVEILSGDYRGARLFGSVTTGDYAEKAFMKFNTMYFQNQIYNIEAIAVDPKTSIPAVDGKVKKHWLHNIIYGFGIGFLDAFSAKRLAESVRGGVNIGGLGNSVTNTDALIESRALGAVSSTLENLGEYRKPTYVKKAFGSVGIVFLTSEGNSSSNKNIQEIYKE